MPSYIQVSAVGKADVPPVALKGSPWESTLGWSPSASPRIIGLGLSELETRVSHSRAAELKVARRLDQALDPNEVGNQQLYLSQNAAIRRSNSVLFLGGATWILRAPSSSLLNRATTALKPRSTIWLLLEQVSDLRFSWGALGDPQQLFFIGRLSDGTAWLAAELHDPDVARRQPHGLVHRCRGVA